VPAARAALDNRRRRGVANTTTLDIGDRRNTGISSNARIAHLRKSSTTWLQNWAAALEDVLAVTNVLSRAEVDDRHHKLLMRPPGHDHH